MPTYVLTTQPGSRTLKGKVSEAALGLSPGAVEWLSPDEACLIADEAGAAEVRLMAALSGLPVDINRFDTRPALKKLLIADMDSTIITCECIDELADALGFKAQVSAITERAMRGEIEFEPALRERVALLKGMDHDALQTVFDARVKLTGGARTLIQTMNAHGAVTALVSGGFTFFTSRVAAAVGFQVNYGNRLAERDGLLTGEVVPPILGREAKRATLERLAGESAIALSDSLAVGDGANDLDMIARAGLGVAFRAKPKVAAAAPARIEHGDLTALLYLQGIRQADFAAS